MAHRLCGLVMMAALAIVEMPAPTWAEDVFLQGYGAGPVPSEMARQQGFRQDWVSFPTVAAGTRVADSGWAWASVSRAPQNGGLPFPSSDQRSRPVGIPRAGAWEAPIRLPHVESPWSVGESYAGPGPALAPPVDGRRREQDRYRIDPYREPFAEPAYDPSGRIGDGSWLSNDRHDVNISPGPERKLVEAPPVRGGTIYGRLLNKGRPLVSCRVAIIPLERSGGRYSVDEARQPLHVTTDNRGEYCFENVPAGAYKLAWLPRGTDQWIRRIHWKPDAVVHDDEVVAIKDIRIALQTIN